MKFNHLKVPSHWQHYWTRHPEGYTIMEALISWVSQVDSMTDNINDWNVYLDEFVADFDTELQNTVTTILEEWNASGFLQELINTFTNERIDSVEDRTTSLENGKVDKNGVQQVTWANLAQDARENIAGDTTAVVGVDSVGTENIIDNAVTQRKTGWLVNNYNMNLFDGVYRMGSVRAGSSGYYLEGTTNPNYNLAVVTVEPNTMYYIKRSLPSRLNIATSTKSIGEGENFDGSVGDNYSQSGVSYYPQYVTVTTGSNDRYMYLSMSVTNTQPYLCVSKRVPRNNTYYYFNQPNSTVDIHNETNLLDKYNLFGGEYERDLQIQGAEPFLYNVRANARTAVIPIVPNTPYTLMREIPSRLNWGTATKLLKIGEALDGTIRQNDSGTGTSSSPQLINFTAGANDRFLYVNMSVDGTEPKLKVVEGTATEVGQLNYDEKKLDNSFKGWLSNYIQSEVSTIDTDTANRLYIANSGEDILITYPSSSDNKIIYEYGRNTNNSIQLDVWRLKNIYYYHEPTQTRYSVTSGDNEGVLKINGEDDYIGGIHGDELQKSLHIYVNGVSHSGTGLNGYYDSIEFVTATDLFHVDTTTKAFTKERSVFFDNTGVHIKTRWKPLGTFDLVHTRATLLSIHKKTDTNNLDIIKTYRTNDTWLPTPVPAEGTTATMPDSATIDTIELIGGLLTAKIWNIKRGEAGNKGTITDFGHRLKAYIDSYTGQTVTPADTLVDEHKFIITAL